MRGFGAWLRGGWGVFVVAGAMLGALWLPSVAAADQMGFASTGAEQTFVVPAGVRTVHVVAVGGKGAGAGSASGGAGAQVTGDLSVTPGQTLYVEVGANGVSGQAASSGPPPTPGPGGAGGFDGGGGGGTTPTGVPGIVGGSGGGGASDVRTMPASGGGSLSSRLLVAGGGGGAGGDGKAGGAAGAAGTNGTAGFPPPPAGGGAGSASGGGQGGCGAADPPENGGPGTGGKGGVGGTILGIGIGSGGGGGGGGFFGGGGGCGGGLDGSSSGGGGGSSFTGSAVNAAVSADASGTPSVVITAVAPPSVPPAPVVQAPADFAPHCGLTASRRQSAFARTGDLVTTVVCDKDASVTETGTVFAPSTRSRVRSARARHRYRVGAGAVQVQAHQAAAVHLRLSGSVLRNIRRALRDHREVSAALSLRATDASGRLAQATTTVDAIRSRLGRATR